MKSKDNLTGQILIAMPSMPDPRFARSVILICEHSDTGALGIILNHPLPEIKFDELLSQLEIPVTGKASRLAVHFGGPVETARGFVLHRSTGMSGPASEGRLDITPDLAMTATRDILAALARGEGPAEAFLALGYSGWAAGQLEAELSANGWLTGPASDALIFGRNNEGKWAEALQNQGIDPSLLSGAAGRA